MSYLLLGRFGPACAIISKKGNQIENLSYIKRNVRFNHITVAFSGSRTSGPSSNRKAIVTSRLTQKQLDRLHARNYSCLSHKIRPSPLLSKDGNISYQGYRDFTSFTKLLVGVARFLKLRYLVLFGATGTGYAVSQQIEKVKSYIPELEWIKEYIPSSENLKEYIPELPDWKNWAVREKAVESFREWRQQLEEVMPERGFMKERLKDFQPMLEDFKEKMNASLPQDLSTTILEGISTARMFTRTLAREADATMTATAVNLGSVSADKSVENLMEQIHNRINELSKSLDEKVFSYDDDDDNDCGQRTLI